MDLFNYTYNLVRQIPHGRVSTYGAVAKALGDSIAARAVGRMMNQNPDPDNMPCFKIVYSDGKLGGFDLGIDDKIRRLNEDNVKVSDGSIVNFKDVFFDEFKTEYPLRTLLNEQLKLRKQIKLEDQFEEIVTVAGVDVAYPENEFEECCGACVVFDYKTKEIIEEKTVFKKINFPYISTYLSFREYPIIENVVKNLKNTPSILMVDGNGILHPRGIGIASYAGVLLDIPSIGIAKKLLKGNVDGTDIILDGKKVGYAFRASNKIKKPIYVSPGNNISFETTLKVVKHFSKFKIPEPVRQAHIVATSNIK
ncbi:MAG: endonuclease V [Candidatus Thermoplasmatota archaeon]|nr:endonuclease V [Candidatus Thermoplasmatota archaeon]